jgi:methylated-DNA-[protein]-cysteine S-methyltransferase
MTLLFSSSLQSPVGIIVVRSNGKSIAEVSFVDEVGEPNECDITKLAVSQLQEYFAGVRTSFALPLAPQGTEFEQSVWNALLKVEYGVTASYLDIAKKLNNTGAIRAVGRANGANPIAIIIPCHRVVGSDGTLTGYSGGLWRKRWLLDHEAKIAGTSLF